MKSFLRFALIIVFIIVCCAACSRDNNKTVDELNEEAVTLLRQNQVSDALDKADKALKKIEKQNDSEGKLKTLQTLALIYHTKGDDEKAEGYYKEMLAITIQIKGKESVEAAKIMNNLGAFCFAQKKYGLAADYYKQTQAIVGKKLSAGDPRLNVIQKNIDICLKAKAGELPKQQSDVNIKRSVPPKIVDYVPKNIKQYMIQSFAKKNNIHLSQLQPQAPVRMGGQGVIFPYRCVQKKGKSGDGIPMIVLFAAVDNQKNEGGFVFKQCRIVSYNSYEAKLKEGGVALLRKELAKVFPDLFG